MTRHLVARAAARTHRCRTSSPGVGGGVRRLTAISALMAWTMCTAACINHLGAEPPGADTSATRITSSRDPSPQTISGLTCLPGVPGVSMVSVATPIARLSVAVARPPGWKRTPRPAPELVMFAEVAPRGDASAMVTVNRIPADVDTAEDALRTHNRAIVAAGGTDLIAVADPVCGLPAELLTVTQPARGSIARRTATMRVVVVKTAARYVAVSLIVEPLTPTMSTSFGRDLTTMTSTFVVTLDGPSI